MVEATSLASLTTWRCFACHRIIGQYTATSGFKFVHKCKCNAWNTMEVLPLQVDREPVPTIT